MSHDERFFVPDAVRAPVFAEQLARLDKRLLRRIKDVDFAAADSLGELAVAFRDYSEVVDSAVDGIDRLDPPQWAADQVGNYQVALRDLQSVSQKYTAMLVADKDKSLDTVDPGKYVRVEKQLRGTAQGRGQDAPQDAQGGRRRADDGPRRGSARVRERAAVLASGKTSRRRGRVSQSPVPRSAQAATACAASTAARGDRPWSSP